MMIYIYVRVCTLDQEMMDISKIATSFLSFLTDVFSFSMSHSFLFLFYFL